ncbi:DoxX family protein [Glycomyces sp. TRM65418]|uniref:DoxX family protein n=1 Tax=Glycomyces sp. TRM65418 TaxID=2867006 RepID=UPI001CE5E50E|nr:DoxX family protein [Glycomyces sp. TRM65418]MCC3763072.1 DoxX family protein [Glycomyces sp. TRM65418]QZD57083.1 DoxX family protein [Glycomyces sp. TRM65418]
MNVFLWVLQGLLAAAFIVSGTLKATRPKEQLAPTFTWVNDFPSSVVKFIGITQVAAALGLILPALTGIAVVLTPLAAVGLAVEMVLAGIYHARKGEWSALPTNAVILILAAVVAWGRFGPHAF